MDSNQNQQGMFDITVEQAKLLGSSQRVKIIGSLTDTPKTAKQVADELGESPGSIHYHIQKLYDGGLIDLVETRTVGGLLRNTTNPRPNGLTRQARNRWILRWPMITMRFPARRSSCGCS